MTRRRLDTELVRRGLAGSRTEAQAAVEAGLVSISGNPATKPATLVADDQAVSIAGQVRRFVSRGGEKLDAAIERLDVDPTGKDCLDAGASTGGFTDCLLRRGASRVIAVDVGYGQLAWELRRDPRVHVLERTNVRDLDVAGLPFRADLVVADLSFISLRVVMPALARLGSDGADLVLLVKPQFEAGRAQVGRGGVVRDPEVWRLALTGVVEAMAGQGIGAVGAVPSPLPGPAGNVEFFLHGRRAANMTNLDLDAVIVEGEGLRR